MLSEAEIGKWPALLQAIIDDDAYDVLDAINKLDNPYARMALQIVSVQATSAITF
jgi:hypothetical protein